MSARTALIALLLAVLGSPSASAQDFSGLRPGIEPFTLEGAESTETEVRRGPFAFQQEFAAVEGFGSGDDQTAFTARLRAGYEATPSVMPFVEGEIARLPPASASFAGLPQDAGTAFRWRAGVAFAPDPSRHGELTVGYSEDQPDDAAAALRMLTFGGSLVWTPTALTSITLEGATSLGLASDASAMTHGGSIDLAYAWDRDLTLIGSAAARQEAGRQAGSVDTSYTAGFGAIWNLDRAHRLTAAYEHAWHGGDDPSRPGQSDTLRFELRMQR